MLKFIETTGKTEEAAIEAALNQLGMDRDDVSVELLERAKPGFLGIGGVPAKVRVSYEAPEEETVVEAAVVSEPVVAEEPVNVVEEKTCTCCEEKAATMEETALAADVGEDDMEQAIVTFLNGLMMHMHVSATARVNVVDGDTYEVEMVGEDLGAIIGRRGETLDAIQQLTSYSVNRGRSKRVRIHVDAENYRAKREESLVRLANKVAAKVVRYRRNVTLEPMNAYERHVIHTALQDVPDVTTYSVGTEPNRRTVVAYGKE